MIINRREGLPGYGNIGKKGQSGSRGLSTYFYQGVLNNPTDIRYVYDNISDTVNDNNIEAGLPKHIEYNTYDYIMDARSYVYTVNEILNSVGIDTVSIPTPLYTYNIGNYYSYYMPNRICSNNYYVDYVTSKNFYNGGNAADYINYIINGSYNDIFYDRFNHIIYNDTNNINSINSAIITPYHVNIISTNNNKNSFSIVAEYSNNTSYNILNSDTSVNINNFVIKNNKNRNMTKSYLNNTDNKFYYPVISLYDYPVRPLISKTFKLLPNNNIDISTALIIDVDSTKNQFEVKWNLNRIFNDSIYFNNNINNYACDLLVYTSPINLVNDSSMTYDMSSGQLMYSNNNYFKYCSSEFELKNFDSNDSSGIIAIIFNQDDSSLDSSINYKFALKIKSKDINVNRPDYLEYGIYSNSITLNASGTKFVLDIIGEASFDVSYNENTISFDISTNIISSDGNIPFTVTSNAPADWITINEPTKKSDNLYNVTVDIESNTNMGQNTTDRNITLNIVGKDIAFNDYKKTVEIFQQGYIDTKPKIDFDITEFSLGEHISEYNQFDNGIYADMVQTFCTIPIFNANRDEWKNAGAKFIELDLDIKITFTKFNTNHEFYDLKGNSFRIGVQYIGKDSSYLNDLNCMTYDYITSKEMLPGSGFKYGKVQDLFNDTGIKMYINDEDTKYLNMYNKYVYCGSDNQYNKLKWINFASDRDTGTNINYNYFSDTNAGVYECILVSDGSALYNEGQQALVHKIIVPIDDALTESEEIAVENFANTTTFSHYLYQRIGPKLRIFLQEELACVSQLKAEVIKKGIKLLDANLKPLQYDNAHNEYTNATPFRFKNINIIDWKAYALTSKNEYDYSPTNSNYVIATTLMSSFFSNDYSLIFEPTISEELFKNKFKYGVISTRGSNSDLSADYKKYAYPTKLNGNSLPSIIGQFSYIKYGFNNTSNSEYSLINGVNVKTSKYKQGTNNYPVYGYLNGQIFDASTYWGGQLGDYGTIVDHQFVIVPSGYSNSYIPDNISRTWYNELKFGSWSVPEIYINSSNVVSIKNHEMTTNRNLDEVRLKHSELLPEFVNGLYQGLTPSTSVLNTQRPLTLNACPFNIFFKISCGNPIISNISNKRIYIPRDVIINNSIYYYMLGRPMIQTKNIKVYQSYFKQNDAETYYSTMPIIGAIMQEYYIK